MAYLSEHENAIDIKSDALQAISEIEAKEADTKHFDIESIIVDTMNCIENDYKADDDGNLFTGLHDLDKITAGLHKEELTIVGARPGVGKTAYALQVMINMARKGNHCLFVSREMSTVQIAKRILSNISAVDGHKLRLCKTLLDDDWVKLGQAAGEISSLPVEINDRISTIQEIRAYCRTLKEKNKLDVLFVDYLGLLKTMKRCESRRQEIEDISRQLKEISMEFEIPVVALCQLNRDSAKSSKEPELHDLRESGSIEQDADNVILLHVPADTDETADSFDIKVIIAKQRNGATGGIYLRYVRKIFRLYSKSNRG